MDKIQRKYLKNIHKMRYNEMYAVRSKAELEFKNDVTSFFKSENFLTKEQ